MHLSFIMDGNRRWAKKLGNIASFGHKNGFKNVQKVLDLARDSHIPYVSFW
jgi:undecaprenyl diphosphate synthase